MRRVRPHALRMRREVYFRKRFVHRILEHVIEAGRTGAALQIVDAAVSLVVEYDHNDFLPHHDRRGQFGIHHHIAPVAHHDKNFAVRQGHLDPEAAGDLVSHAGIGVLDVVSGGPGRAPELVQFARQGARRANHHRVFVRRPVDGPEDLHVRERRTPRFG